MLFILIGEVELELKNPKTRPEFIEVSAGFVDPGLVDPGLVDPGLFSTMVKLVPSFGSIKFSTNELNTLLYVVEITIVFVLVFTTNDICGVAIEIGLL
jgi:hypothetical protein